MSDSISILAYNAHLFDKSVAATASKMKRSIRWLTRGKTPILVYRDEERFTALVERLMEGQSSFDIIGVSELWAHHYQNLLSKKMSSRYSSYSFQGERKFSGGAGLALLVKGKFFDRMAFTEYKGMVEDDQYSWKGVAYGQMTIGGRTVFVIQTHAQASYTGKEALTMAARKKQLNDTLFPIVERGLKTGNPVFLIGDMNIEDNTPEFAWFDEKMRGYGLRDAWLSADRGKSGITYDPNANNLVKKFDETMQTPQRIDYIFHDPRKSSVAQIDVSRDWRLADGTDVSDHFPLSARFELA